MFGLRRASLLQGGSLIVANDKKLIDVLVDTGKIKKENVRDFGNLSNQTLEDKLKAQGILSEEDINRAYGILYALPAINLKDLKIPKETLAIIPENLARQYKIVAYEKTNDVLKVAVAEPGKLSTNLNQVLEDIKTKKGLKIMLAMTSMEDLNFAIEQYFHRKTPPAVTQKASREINLETIQIPYEVISKFPEDIARKYKMVVFEAPHPSFIKVAVADPSDKKVREILDFIREKNDIAIEEYIATPGQIHQSFRFYEPPKTAISSSTESTVANKPAPPSVSLPPITQAVPELAPKKFVSRPAPPVSPSQGGPPGAPITKPVPAQKTSLKEEEIPEVQGKETETPLDISNENDLDTFLGQEIKDVGDLQAFAEGEHIPKTIAAIIALAVRNKASDIHIEPTEKFLRVRYRIDGILRDIIKLPLEQQPAIISRIKILSNLKIDESRIPQDGRFDVKTSNHQIDLRISTLPTVNGEKAAMRILDKSLQMYTLEELGLAGRGLKILIENIDKPYGIVLATGPTGSGKSTTLYAILSRISTASVNIITLEDPVEYELPGLNQCQIKPKIGFTFANGLRSVLRQDPNIIMVGEIRDAETASLATHAALTGQLVLSTLHTNDATGALPRLTNMGVEPFLITSSTNCIIGQRLVRRLCAKCKRPAHIPEPVEKEIERELAKFNLPKPYHFFEGKGCPECNQGYQGRVGIFEVLPMSEKIENLAITRRPASEIKTAAIEEGMITMKQDGLIKAIKGITTVNEVLRVVSI